MEVPRSNLNIQDEYSKVVSFLAPEVKAALEARDFTKSVEQEKPRAIPETGFDVNFDVVRWAGVKTPELNDEAFKKLSKALGIIHKDFGGIKGALAKAISLKLRDGQFMLLSYFALGRKESERYDILGTEFVPQDAR